ncbi:MAG: glucose-6-phosphate isomerase [Bacteroidetes bacterium]|nr:glucose-6-phosphate isomerase [Bacteroidota bacterium]
MSDHSATRIRIDYGNTLDALDSKALDAALGRVRDAQSVLQQRSGPGSEFLGWVDLPAQARDALQPVQDTAERIRSQADVLIVIGIGGSYLGARAVIEALRPPFDSAGTQVLYAGHHIDGGYLRGLMDACADRRVALNVISKSGTTTEPALAFRVLRQWMEERYGRQEAAARIYATTDAQRGALRRVADEEGYTTFVIPDDVGGRFSVLTPVGLLPIAASGIDVAALLDGAVAMRETALLDDADRNPALRYAQLRDALYRSGKHIEVLASFHPPLTYVAEWWKQLFGESEGKDGKGIFPAAVSNTTDLHSMGQYIQDGERRLFETFLFSESVGTDIEVPSAVEDTDGLNFLAGSRFAEVNADALRGTALAHHEGGVPNATILLPGITPASIGALLYFFETAVALGGYALGVNPFDQPGVEAYKRNMFALLRKPGFEETRERLLARLSGNESISG